MARVFSYYVGGQHGKQWNAAFTGAAGFVEPPASDIGAFPTALNLAGGPSEAVIFSTARGEEYGMMWVRPVLSITNPFLKWKLGSTVLDVLRLNVASQKWEFLRGDSATLLGTGVKIISAGSWICIEWRLQIGNSNVFNLWVNGVSDIALSGVDTSPGSETTLDRFEVWDPGGNPAIGPVLINDINGGVDNGQIGVIKIVRQLPTGDSATNNAWTGSAGGTKALLVDEKPPNDDTDYVYSTTTGQKQGHTFAASLIPATASILAVAQEHYLKKVTSGQVKIGMRSNATEDVDAAIDIATSYDVYQKRRTTDPSGGGAWTVSRVDANESYIESVL